MGFSRAFRSLAAALAALLAAGCNNTPWPEAGAKGNTLFSAVVQSSPRHLDPTASYWNNDTAFTYQIYEPPYGYHYLKRPFELVPKTSAAVVAARYIGKDGQVLAEDAPAEQVVESVYDVPIKPGIRFQPHPAFALDEQGPHRYHAMKPGELGARRTPWDF
ncbi:MAG: peptide ABC transporter substrate-binding protein, partial [Rubrivivax sp.]